MHKHNVQRPDGSAVTMHTELTRNEAIARDQHENPHRWGKQQLVTQETTAEGVELVTPPSTFPTGNAYAGLVPSFDGFDEPAPVANAGEVELYTAPPTFNPETYNRK